jgi:hypothetical protein
MVRFDFTLNDVDASVLIGILIDEKVRVMNLAQECIKENMSKTDQSNFEWYTSQAKYLDELRQKVSAGSKQVKNTGDLRDSFVKTVDIINDR